MFLKPVNEQGNNETLGVRLSDYMSGLNTDLQAASDNVVQQARTITATVKITKWEVQDGKLIVEVAVTNKTGHRFPSGVGFRRAFLNLEATVDGKPFFTSGTTNSTGQITNLDGQVLPTETFQNCMGQKISRFRRSIWMRHCLSEPRSTIRYTLQARASR